jgi:protein-ribulosamine 3-kinase
MLPVSLQNAIEQKLGCKILQAKNVGGGSINVAARLETTHGNYFIKWNSASQFPGMFEAEAKGLALLEINSGFAIPKVISVGNVQDQSYILMTHLDAGRSNWTKAGQLLAKMHTVRSGEFGLDHDNYIGSLSQKNTTHKSWPEFFTNERVLPQVQLAVDKGLLDRSDSLHAGNFCLRINEIFPIELPSLLHGDLWSGNMMFSSKGPSIFDPAVYYGHREMDIAMTKLFGGFESGFYESYNEVLPLEKNWEQRVQYCNLYPLLVHVNLFGGGYVNDVRRILNHFTQ